MSSGKIPELGFLRDIPQFLSFQAATYEFREGKPSTKMSSGEIPELGVAKQSFNN